MKGAGTLVLLLVLALVAGVLLAVTRQPAPLPDPDPPAGRPADEAYLEDLLGLSFRKSPRRAVVTPEVLLDEIGASLDAQFGPSGLARRTRAYELLGLTAPGRNLRSELVAADSAGIRGWFNPQTGQILLPQDFNPGTPHDRVALHGLLARALAHQHAPLTIGTLPDDEWVAQRGLRNAVAGWVEAVSRKSDPAPFRVPMPFETEREATLLGLSTVLHAHAEFESPSGQARVFLESRVTTGARALPDLLRDPPRSTFAILGGDPTAPTRPSLPDLGQPLLEESLGALHLQTLLEWLDDFERARVLALLWRGDRYRLYTDEWGDHLVWIVSWHTPESAQRAAAILKLLTDQSAAPDQSPSAPRHLAVHLDHKRTIFANSASAESLAALRTALRIPDSPPPLPP